MRAAPWSAAWRPYLAVVEVLDDRLALLADVTDADELGLAVALEKAPPKPLDHGRRRATAGHAAVLDVPEHAHGGRVLWTADVRGAWGRSRGLGLMALGDGKLPLYVLECQWQLQT